MRRLLVLMVGLASLCAGAAERPRVVVVKSADRTAYSAVVAGFAAELRGQVEEVVLEESGDGARVFQRIADSQPALVLAIGPSAAALAKRALTSVPILFCMVPYYEKYGLEGPNVSGIAMTSDLSVQLAALKAVSPNSRRVGILHDPRYSGVVVEEAKTKAREKGMVVVGLEVDSEGQVEKALSSARSKVDALLMVGDKTVATAAVVKQLITFANEERMPLVALSASQVKEGAMLSIAPSPSGIGQQAGRLANRIIHEKVAVGALAVAQPETMDLAMNLTTAKRLGATCDVSLEIFRFAARQSFPIRVFE